LGQKLAVWFGHPQRKHLALDRRLSKTSVETHGAGGKPDDCPPPPDLPYLFNLEWPDFSPVVIAGSEMDGWQPRLPPLWDVSIGCFCC
jgi:hypothetical protein